MSYGVYKDSALTRLTTENTPKWFLCPTAGAVKTGTLYIGDPVTPLTGMAALLLIPVGGDVAGLRPNLQVALRPSGAVSGASASFNIPNTPLVLPPADLSRTIAFDLQVTCPAGNMVDYEDWRIEVIGVPNQLPMAYCGLARADQGLAQRLRVLDPARRVGTMPGFIWGQSRWRDETETNEQTLVPTRWDISPASVGLEKFIYGIGCGDDLKLLSVERASGGSAIYPRLQKGEYFTGPNRHYFAADPNGDGSGLTLELLPAITGFTLASTPRPQTPIFVGRWRRDGAGVYDTDVSFRYIGAPFAALNPFDPNNSGPQFVLDRRTNRVTLNQIAPAMATSGSLFLGVIPAPSGGANSASFYTPLFPVYSVQRVWADNPPQPVERFSFDPSTGLVTIPAPSGSGPRGGRPVYADYQAGLAIVYENLPDPAQTQPDTRLVELDLNPATNGTPSGTLHLMHRRWQPLTLDLYADKPRITVPASLAGQPGITAFGPVYYDKDYALLIVTANGANSQETVPGVRLRVVVSSGFEGRINYQDPTTQTLEVVTGGDGTASLLYLPPPTYGWYLDPPTSATATTITLPDVVPLPEVYTAAEGWSVLTYQVKNTDAYLGKVGANVSQGEVPWTTTGVPGTDAYQTNGNRVLLQDAQGNTIYPVAARDSAGTDSQASGFNGNVTTLVYNAGVLPLSDPATGALFVAVEGRVTIQLVSDDYGLSSNPIVLQLGVPQEVTDQGPEGTVTIPGIRYFMLNDSAAGLLDNQYNWLGGVALPPIVINPRT